MATVHDPLSTTGQATGRIERNLVMTPDADKFLASLAQSTGLREGDVSGLALGILRVAVDARAQGKHVGVASSSEALDIELVGF